MYHISKVLENQPTLGLPRDNASPQNTEEKLNSKNKEKLAEIISQACALQKQYGKTRQELETLVEGFAWALASYKIQDITKAFRVYVKNNSDIPAPNDILKIIENNGKAAHKVPSADDLLRYRSKGIPLTPTDYKRLEEAGYGIITELPKIIGI